MINGNTQVNPLSDENYYLVYNHPDAEFSLSLQKENVPADTLLLEKRYFAYANFLVGMGITYSLPSNQPNWCKLEEDPILSAYVRGRSYKDMPQTISPGFPPTWFRPQNLLLQSANTSGTELNDVAFTKLSDLADMFEYWFTHTYHVRDLRYADTGGALPADNSVFKIWSKVHYDEHESLADCFIGLGLVHQYGMSTYSDCFNDKSNAPYDYLSKNALMFRLLSPATFPGFSEMEKRERRICLSENLKISQLTESDILHLRGKSIDCGNFSPSFYQPEYSWEMSVDGQNWEIIDADNRYRLYRENLSFFPVMDNQKDLLLNASILKGKPVMYFRQRAVLKAFASKTQSSLYRYYDETTGLYYIVLESEDRYTYRPNPTALKENFVFVGGMVPEETLCYGETPASTQIQFRLQPDDNLSATDVSQLESIADYRIWRLDNTTGEPVELVSDRPYYNAPFHVGDTLRYRAVIAFCHDSLWQDIFWRSLMLDSLSVGQISSSNAHIVKRDSLNSTVTLMCLKGLQPQIVINGEPRGFRYSMRTETGEWTDFTEPSLYTTTLPVPPKEMRQTYFIRKQNAQGCVSDSLRILVNFFDGIADNRIYFQEAPTLDTLYVSQGAAFPEIHGNLVSGGYGYPSLTNDYSYTYQWIHRVGDQWQVLRRAQIVDDGSESLTSLTPYVSLFEFPEGTPSECEYLARVVYSRSAMNGLTQVVDTSNVLCVKMEPAIEISKLSVYDQLCAGEDVLIELEGAMDKSRYAYRYVLSDQQVDSEARFLNDGRFQITLKSPQSDLTVWLYRENLQSGSRSDELVIPVEVQSIALNFAIEVGGRLHDLSEGQIEVNAGERIQLINYTSGASQYEWILQVQQDQAKEVYGDRSERHDPVCYLYNPGYHKFILNATNDKGCRASLIADQVFVVNGASLRRSYFEAEEDAVFPSMKPLLKVYPTILSPSCGNLLHLETSQAGIPVRIWSASGVLYYENSEVSEEKTIDVSVWPKGVYLVKTQFSTTKIIIQ